MGKLCRSFFYAANQTLSLNCLFVIVLLRLTSLSENSCVYEITQLLGKRQRFKNAVELHINQSAYNVSPSRSPYPTINCSPNIKLTLLEPGGGGGNHHQTNKKPTHFHFLLFSQEYQHISVSLRH